MNLSDPSDCAFLDQLIGFEIIFRKRWPNMIITLTPASDAACMMRSHSSTVAAIGLSRRICFPDLSRHYRLLRMLRVRSADEYGVDIATCQQRWPRRDRTQRHTPWRGRARVFLLQWKLSRAPFQILVMVSALVRPMKPDPITPIRMSSIMICQFEQARAHCRRRSPHDRRRRCAHRSIFVTPAAAFCSGSPVPNRRRSLPTSCTSFAIASNPCMQEVSMCTAAKRRIKRQSYSQFMKVVESRQNPRCSGMPLDNCAKPSEFQHRHAPVHQHSKRKLHGNSKRCRLFTEIVDERFVQQVIGVKLRGEPDAAHCRLLTEIEWIRIAYGSVLAVRYRRTRNKRSRRPALRLRSLCVAVKPVHKKASSRRNNGSIDSAHYPSSRNTFRRGSAESASKAIFRYTNVRRCASIQARSGRAMLPPQIRSSARESIAVSRIFAS